MKARVGELLKWIPGRASDKWPDGESFAQAFRAHVG